MTQTWTYRDATTRRLVVAGIILALTAWLAAAWSGPQAQAGTGNAGVVVAKVQLPVALPPVGPSLCGADGCTTLPVFAGGSLQDLQLQLDYALARYDKVPDVRTTAGTPLPATTHTGAATGYCAGKPGVLIDAAGALYDSAATAVTVVGPDGQRHGPVPVGGGQREVPSVWYALCA